MNPPELEAGLMSLWEHACARWQDEAAHQAFLQACDDQKNLAFAARLYRSEKESNPERAEEAGRQLQMITTLALSQMEAAKRPPTSHKRLVTAIAAVVSLGLISVCMYLVTR